MAACSNASLHRQACARARSHHELVMEHSRRFVFGSAAESDSSRVGLLHEHLSAGSAGGPHHHQVHMSVGMEFYSKNPTPIGSRPSGLSGLWRMTTQETPPPRTHKEGQGGQGKPNRKEQLGRGGRANRGSTAARPTLTRDWGGPQVRDPVPIVSVNPEADPPQPRAPVRPNRAEQDGETAEEKSQEHEKNTSDFCK